VTEPQFSFRRSVTWCISIDGGMNSRVGATRAMHRTAEKANPAINPVLPGLDQSGLKTSIRRSAKGREPSVYRCTCGSPSKTGGSVNLGVNATVRRTSPLALQVEQSISPQDSSRLGFQRSGTLQGGLRGLSAATQNLETPLSFASVVSSLP
jgi:hypothetical protein